MGDGKLGMRLMDSECSLMRLFFCKCVLLRLEVSNTQHFKVGHSRSQDGPRLPPPDSRFRTMEIYQYFRYDSEVFKFSCTTRYFGSNNSYLIRRSLLLRVSI